MGDEQQKDMKIILNTHMVSNMLDTETALISGLLDFIYNLPEEERKDMSRALRYVADRIEGSDD